MMIALGNFPGEERPGTVERYAGNTRRVRHNS